MLEHLMEPNSEELTSSVVASHVSPIPLLEAVRRLVTSVISGERSSALWGKRNPDGSWERTSQDSLALNLEDSSGEWSMTWPRWGTGWGGLVMEHPTLERFTAETVSSSLPTPTSSEHKYRLQEDSQQSNCLEARARRGELLPTPQAWDAKDYHAAKPEIVKTREQQKKRGGGCANLAERMAAQMLPTPRSCSAMGAAINPNAEFPNLETVIAQSVAEIGESGESTQRLGLNPEFVEVMMGFPTGWTDLNHLETP